MRTLSSRPDTISKQELMQLATPAVKVLTWISSKISFPDNTQRSVSAGYQMIEEILDCMQLHDWLVMASPSPMDELHYDVGIKPVPTTSYISFKIVFNIRP